MNKYQKALNRVDKSIPFSNNIVYGCNIDNEIVILKELVDRATPKNTTIVGLVTCCPVCNTEYDWGHYCEYCGQAIYHYDLNENLGCDLIAGEKEIDKIDENINILEKMIRYLAKKFYK